MVQVKTMVIYGILVAVSVNVSVVKSRVVQDHVQRLSVNIQY